MVETAAMEPMAAGYAAHAPHAAPIAITHATDVTATETEAAHVTSAEAATSEATAMTTAEAATPMTAAAPATSTAHEHQQTAPCVQVGVIGVARLRKRCRGRKSKRKSADDTKRNDAVFHDCTPRGRCTASSLPPTQVIGRHLRLVADPPSGFFLKGACKRSSASGLPRLVTADLLAVPFGRAARFHPSLPC
jgi:hypothetical protein